MPGHHHAFKMLDAILLNYDRNRRVYLILFVVYVFGVSLGAFWVNGMGYDQQIMVNSWFDQFAATFTVMDVAWAEIFFVSLSRHVFIVLMLWFAGTSIAGRPLVYCIPGIKGFITGLSSGFIMKAKGFWGVGYAMISLLPSEMIELPVVIALASLAISFSSCISEGRPALKLNFRKYCFDAVTFLFVLCLLSFFEALILPGMMRTMLANCP